MKKLCVLIAIVAVLGATKASAFSVTESRQAGFFTYPGGEFTFTINDPSYDYLLNQYVGVPFLTKGVLANSFQTFCISTSIGLQTNPQNATLDPNGVSVGAAWLYSQFVKGTLAGYNYLPGAGREASADSLQDAIWILQNQTLPNGATDVADATPFINLVTGHFGTLAAAKVLGVQAYGIDALRLVGANGQTAQPMLVAVPDGGSALILLGLGLSGLAMVSRKLRA